MGKKKSIKNKPPQDKKQSSSLKKSQTAVIKSKSKESPKTSKKSMPNRSSSEAKAEKKQAVKKQKTAGVPAQMTAEDLDHFRQLLMNKLHEILGDVNWIEGEALRKSRQDAAGDLSTMPIHMADLGTDNYEQEFSLGLMDSERKIVHEILDALRRIALGTYGICEGTGQPIPRARLEANPWARYCVEYASQIERGKVIENKHSRTMSFGEEGEDDRDTPERDEDEDDTFLEEEHEETGEVPLTDELLDEEESDGEEEEHL